MSPSSAGSALSQQPSPHKDLPSWAVVAAITCLKRGICGFSTNPCDDFPSLCPSSNYRRDLKSLEGDIHGCGKSIRKEEEKNETLVSLLNRSQNDASVTRRLIAQCLLEQEALQAQTGTYTRVLQETEQALSRTKMVRRVYRAGILLNT